MSDARAIEAVTEALRTIVDAGIKSVEPGARAITLPPHEVAPAQDPRCNVFLYQTTLDGHLRNTDPTNVAPGETGQPALPLILHYILTPYAPDGDDVLAHRMLGAALQVLHSRQRITGTDLSDIAPYSDVGKQVEHIRIAWQPLDEREIYSLWSVFQAPYRLSVAFEVRVVLIDSTVSAHAPMPVLRRGADANGPRAEASVLQPELVAVIAPQGQPYGVAGESVALLGTALADAVEVTIAHPTLPAAIAVPPASITDDEVRFPLPASVPAGFGTVSVLLRAADGTERRTNEMPLGVGPTITSPMPMHVASAGTTTTIAMTCAPTIRAGQQAALLIGGRSIRADQFGTDTNDVSFTVASLDPGDYRVRLRIDGTDSRIVKDRVQQPPQFDASQMVTVA